MQLCREPVSAARMSECKGRQYDRVQGYRDARHAGMPGMAGLPCCQDATRPLPQPMASAETPGRELTFASLHRVVAASLSPCLPVSLAGYLAAWLRACVPVCLCACISLALFVYYCTVVHCSPLPYSAVPYPSASLSASSLSPEPSADAGAGAGLLWLPFSNPFLTAPSRQ